jgi:hypothetical protein
MTQTGKLLAGVWVNVCRRPPWAKGLRRRLNGWSYSHEPASSGLEKDVCPRQLNLTC